MRRLTLLLVLTVAGGCSEALTPAEEYLDDPEALARGRAIFIGTCSGYCHSPTAANRDAPYLFDCHWVHGGSDRDIHRIISTGVPNTRMLGFAGKLPDGEQDLWKVIAFLKSERRC